MAPLLAPPDYPPIAERGVVGDLCTVALVTTDGSVDWLCLPRIDSPSVFGAIPKNEIVILYSCDGDIQGIAVDPPQPPGVWIQCFVDGGACQGDDMGFWFFDIPAGPIGEAFIRMDGEIPSGAPISGTIIPENGFERGTVGVFSTSVQ
mgnify:CR=1 FL=1